MLYRNRFYSTELGRFLQRDPIGYRSRDMNIYRYVFNRALVLTDAGGLTPPWELPTGPVYGPHMPTGPSTPSTTWPSPTPHGCTLMADGSVRCGTQPSIPMPQPIPPTIDDDGGPGTSNIPIDPNTLPRLPQESEYLIVRMPICLIINLQIRRHALSLE